MSAAQGLDADGLVLVRVFALLAGADASALDKAGRAADARPEDPASGEAPCAPPARAEDMHERLRKGVTRVLRMSGLETQQHQGEWTALPRVPMPVLALAGSGRLMIVSRTQQGHWWTQEEGQAQPAPIEPAALASRWGGWWWTAQPQARQEPGAMAPEAEPQRFGWRWFLEAMRPYRRLLSEVLLASLVLQVLALLTPLVFQVVIDKVLNQRSASTLDVLVAALLAIGLFEVVLGGLRHHLGAHAAHGLDVTLGVRVFRHLLRLPLPYFEGRRSGEVVARMRELDTVRAFMTGPVLTTGLDLAFVFVFLAVMAIYSLWLTAVVLVFLPVFGLLSWGLGWWSRRDLEGKYAQASANQAFLVETVGAMRTVKSQGCEAAWQAEWSRRLADQAQAGFRAGGSAQRSQQAISAASRVMMVLLLWLGARQVMAGELTVGGLIAFNMLASRVCGPILKLASLWQDVMQLRLSLRRLAEIMLAVPEPMAGRYRPLPGIPPRSRGELRLEGVTFTHGPGRAAVLEGVSLTLTPGEVVGLIGASGCGKTTLMRLLQGLYAPHQGRILLDGVDLVRLDPAQLRRQVALVSQEPQLFDRTVRENIALGREDLTMEAVVRAARIAGAHEFILQLPQGYDTRVGEQGGLLSGGQRARIALARALAGDPPVLLLDEATAWLDDSTERRLQAELAQACQGRTVLIAAHRLSTLRGAGRVLWMQGARLKEVRLQMPPARPVDAVTGEAAAPPASTDAVAAAASAPVAAASVQARPAPEAAHA